MPDETSGQGGSQTGAVAVAPQGGAGGAVAGGTAPVADPVVTPTFDYSTADGIRKAAEQNPALKAWREEGFEAGKQRRNKEILSEQGSVERAQQTMSYLAQQLAAGADPNELGKQVPLYVKANEDFTRVALNRAYVEASLSHFGTEEGEVIKAALAQVEDDPTASSALASQVMEAVFAKGKSSALEEADPETLKEHPRFKDWFAQNAQHETEVEMNAREIEAKKVLTPQVPSGSSVAEAMTADRLAAMPSEERRAFIATQDAAGRDGLWDVIGKGMSA